MPNFLDSIELPDQVQCPELLTSQDVAQDVTPLLGGHVHVSESPVLSGQPLTLIFEDGVEWADQVTVDAFLMLSKDVGATFNLQWNGVTYPVVFRHSDPPAVRFDPIWPFHPDHVGEVRLMRV